MKAPHLKKVVQDALLEDAAYRDVTTRALVGEDQKSRAYFLAKQDFILCGMPLVKEVFGRLDSRSKLKIFFKEGSPIAKGKEIAMVSGKTRSLLSGERVALNFLQHLSGIATLTREFVRRTRGTRAKIIDTRKTLPGLRALERYAVRVGGGVNYRFNLEDMPMVKDNHLEILPSISVAYQKISAFTRKKIIIVEVKNFRELEEALAARVPRILLDNWRLAEIRKAVQRVKGRAQLEASGGVRLRNVGAIAKTGVDFISVGALTHSAPAVDISLEFA